MTNTPTSSPISTPPSTNAASRPGRAFCVLFRNALYPDQYAWYVLASSLDIMLTYVIVWKLGGREVNAIAQHFINALGHWGLILLKFATIILVVAICEVVGRANRASGRRLAIAAICISALPVGAAILQFLAWTHLGIIEVPAIDPPTSTRGR